MSDANANSKVSFGVKLKIFLARRDDRLSSLLPNIPITLLIHPCNRNFISVSLSPTTDSAWRLFSHCTQAGREEISSKTIVTSACYPRGTRRTAVLRDFNRFQWIPTAMASIGLLVYLRFLLKNDICQSPIPEQPIYEPSMLRNEFENASRYT